MIAWMLYATLLSVLIGLAALALERAGTLFRLPVRWVWCLALAAGVILPLLPRESSVPEVEAGVSRLDAAELLQLPGAAIERAGLSLPSVNFVLGVAWVAASFGFLLWLAWCAWKLRRESAGWNREVVDGTPVLVSENLGPAVLGPTGTAIVIPRWLLSAPAESRRLALEHERSHLAARDATLGWAATVAVIAMPWNLALWWVLARLRAAIELDCDRRVLEAGAPARRYAELLLQLAGPSRRWLLRPTLSQPETVLGKRILAMMGTRARFRILQAFGLAAVSVTLVLLACQTEAPQAPSATSQTSQAPDPDTVAEGGKSPAPYSGPSDLASMIKSKPRMVWGPAPPLRVEKAKDDLVIRLNCAQSCAVTSDPAIREPLFLVDGVIQNRHPDLKALEGRIELIEVLKGPAARVEYGDRGSNGVIVIFTKKR
jgi:hypothetical protein